MSAFGGLIITNVGRALQAKAQLGAQLQFTRMGLGDGELGGSSIVDLTALKHEVKSLTLSRFELLTSGRARLGTVLSNQDIASGFYWRELGIFAEDPDLGEILYCYGNAGALAEYIPAGGGPDVIEKVITVIVLIGQASSVSAVLDQSLAWATQQDLAEQIAAANQYTDQQIGVVIQDLTTLQQTVAAHQADKASETTLGHIKIGAGGSIDQNGVYTPGRYKIINTSHNLEDTGNQVVTGVGFKPRCVVALSAMVGGSASVGVKGPVEGYELCIFSNYITPTDWNSESTLVRLSIDAANRATASLISYDTDGFTLSWSKTGTPSGPSYTRFLVFE